MTGQELATQNNPLALPDEQTLKRGIQAINRFQDIVHANLVRDQDFGIIPGTSKPTLLKPGAEKIAKLLGLADTYEILDRQENWDKPFFRYLIKCKLVSVTTGTVISEGLGECNSMESKYRYRDMKRKCPQCGKETIIKGKAEYGGGWLCFQKTGGCGWKCSDGTEEADALANQAVGKVENEDIYTQVNTLLKMAKKRAMVDASLSAGRLSNVFTQDMEDMPEPPAPVRPKGTTTVISPKAKQTIPKASAKDVDDLYGESLKGANAQPTADKPQGVASGTAAPEVVATATAEIKTPAAKADGFDRQAAWITTCEKVKALKIEDKLLLDWWERHDVEVSPGTFKEPMPPERIINNHLKTFLAAMAKKEEAAK